MLNLNPMGVVRKAKRKMKSQRTLRTNMDLKSKAVCKAMEELNSIMYLRANKQLYPKITVRTIRVYEAQIKFVNHDKGGTHVWPVSHGNFENHGVHVNHNISVSHPYSETHKFGANHKGIETPYIDVSQNGFDPHYTDVSVSHHGVVTHTEDASHVDNETHLNVASHIGHETYGRIANYREAIRCVKPIECVRSHEKIEYQALNVSHPVSEPREATANQHNESHMLNVIQEIFAVRNSHDFFVTHLKNAIIK